MKHSKKPIVAIYRSKKTVFSLQEIAILWGETNKGRVINMVNYYIRTGLLHHIRRGIYSKAGVYDRRELATKILVPSYVSFETVLVDAAIVYQRYDRIFVASYVTRDVEVAGQTFSFRRLPEHLFANPLGIINRNGTSIATPERAFLDTIYTHKGYHFDNLDSIDWKKAEKLLPIYAKKRMIKSLERYRKQYELQRRAP